LFLVLQQAKTFIATGFVAIRLTLLLPLSLSDLNYVAKMWSKDYMTWHAIMKKYEMVSNSNTC